MPLPIISNNFSFATESGLCPTDIHSAHNEDIIFTMLCIQKQKNNDNGQKLTYQCCTDSDWMCPTQASLDIIRQACHLVPRLTHQPRYTGMPHQANATRSVEFLCHVAHKVFSIPKDHQDLHAWSFHSIRVKAANMLHCV